MMLLGDFFTYRLVEQSDQKLSAEIILNKRHKIFMGHFTNNPIVPGVCQIQIVTDILTDTYNNKFQLLEANNIKFLSMIHPQKVQKLKLELRLTRMAEKRLKIKGVLSVQDQVCMKIQGIFCEE